MCVWPADGSCARVATATTLMVVAEPAAAWLAVGGIGEGGLGRSSGKSGGARMVKLQVAGCWLHGDAKGFVHMELSKVPVVAMEALLDALFSWHVT